MREHTEAVKEVLAKHRAHELIPGPGDPVFVDGCTEENVILACLSRCTAYDPRTEACLEELLGLTEEERVHAQS